MVLVARRLISVAMYFQDFCQLSVVILYLAFESS